MIRRCLVVLAVATVALAAWASPSMAVVGGHNAQAGAYPAIAEITYGPFLCSGTLIAPKTVLTAGHCSSVTGAAVSSPASWPAPLIDVRVGGLHPGEGQKAPVGSVTMEPNYLLGSGYDISLLNLSSASSKTPVKVAGASEGSLWSPSTLETIVGWGATQEDGDLPDTLQEGQVPITTDAYCGGAYSDFDARTMVCAGYPQGGVDTCQGDSGGPMFGRTSGGVLRVVGATSFGEGCARAGKPGVYARVADSELREWIRSNAPDGVN